MFGSASGLPRARMRQARILDTLDEPEEGAVEIVRQRRDTGIDYESFF
jgi:hypothetical protein